jgi:hypothetical protein
LDWRLTDVLPKQGGTLDQDPEFMRDLRKIIGLENAIEKQQVRKKDLQKQLKKGR